MTIKIPEHAQKAIDLLSQNGYTAYAVGGCIRDSFLEKTPDDWDICTECRPDEIKRIFSRYRTIDTGIKHGTITVMIDRKLVEITTFRSDGEYENHRKPAHVEFVTSLQDDLKRRDFTINAMCSKNGIEIIDPFGGQKDLKQGIIRCVGDPSKRFEEDALRILRGLRFASVLDFEIEKNTKVAMFDKMHLLKCISEERICVELKKLICGKAADKILLEYRDIIAVIIPEIEPCFDFKQNNPHHCYTVWKHIVKSLSFVRPEPVMRMTMLLHDIEKPKMATVDDNGISHFKKHQYESAQTAAKILNRLRFDNHSAKYICGLITEHDNRIPAEMISVKRFISKHGFQFMFDYLEVRRADTYAQSDYLRQEKLHELDELARLTIELMEEDCCLKLSDLEVNGNDLISLGLSGKQVGERLRLLLEMVIDGKLQNRKDALLNYIKESKDVQ